MSPLPDAQFAEVFRRHYPRLVGLASRVLGDAREAEDAAQEALLAVRIDPVAERGDDDVAAWLSRVVINGSLNRLRSRRRADVLAQVVGARELPPPSDEPAQAAEDADERERVRATLAVLPERQAAALLLRHAGHSYSEIATALGVAEGSVGVLLARGERAFRRAHEEMNQ
ncbi:MAG TPA: sigma-70 family RNA polymerase sigma factor [Acidimicrobiia bacterium]|nr:sigma-70 family RNA polymerase sigma factor [Acidimicrobiia bacterium]